jgi:hypothetical protein
MDGGAMTVAELLVSACIAALAAGAALTAVVPLQRGFSAQPEAAGLIQRARVVAELLSGDLRHASLVLPLRIGAAGDDISRGVFYRPDVMTAVLDPADALASGLVTPSSSRTYHLNRDAEGVWQLMQYDGQASDQPAVEEVVGLDFEYFGAGEPPATSITARGTLRTTYGPVPPSPATDDPDDSWGAGENCAFAFVGADHVPRLQPLGAGMVSLPPAVLMDGPWCPDAAHAFRFDADLLRVRRVRVRVRLQAARPFRGLVESWVVPDQRLLLDVALRNARAAR